VQRVPPSSQRWWSAVFEGGHRFLAGGGCGGGGWKYRWPVLPRSPQRRWRAVVEGSHREAAGGRRGGGVRHCHGLAAGGERGGGGRQCRRPVLPRSPHRGRQRRWRHAAVAAAGSSDFGDGCGCRGGLAFSVHGTAGWLARSCGNSEGSHTPPRRRHCQCRRSAGQGGASTSRRHVHLSGFPAGVAGSKDSAATQRPGRRPPEKVAALSASMLSSLVLCLSARSPATVAAGRGGYVLAGLWCGDLSVCRRPEGWRASSFPLRVCFPLFDAPSDP